MYDTCSRKAMYTFFDWKESSRTIRAIKCNVFILKTTTITTKNVEKKPIYWNFLEDMCKVGEKKKKRNFVP